MSTTPIRSQRFRGDLSKIAAFIPFAEEDDVERYTLFLSHEVDAKKLKSYPVFKKWRVGKTHLLYHNASALEAPSRPMRLSNHKSKVLLSGSGYVWRDSERHCKRDREREI